MDKEEFLNWYLTSRTPEKTEYPKPERKPRFHKKKKAKVAKKKPKPKKNKPERVEYYVYINSKKWADKSRKWRKETGKCETCGSTENLQCHHLHYRTLGRENRKDIQVLCAGCHMKVHNILPPETTGLE
jgi:5-methylcytosine-specific restriction endonuclease McrA